MSTDPYQITTEALCDAIEVAVAAYIDDNGSTDGMTAAELITNELRMLREDFGEHGAHDEVAYWLAEETVSEAVAAAYDFLLDATPDQLDAALAEYPS